MADPLNQQLERPILLFEMIQELRTQLQASLYEAREQDLRFAVKDVELELQVAVMREREAGGGLKFWVIDASGGRKSGETVTHRFKLTLEPVTGPSRSDDSRLLVSDEVAQKPR